MTTQLIIPEKAFTLKETTAPFTALTYTARTTLDTLKEHGAKTGQLFEEVARLNWPITGPVHFIYTDVNGDPTNEFKLEIALPVAATGDAPEGLSLVTFPSFRCLSYTYTGSWDDFPALYDALFEQFRGDGYQTDGRVREVYTVVDFDNPDRHVTDIQIGLA